MNRILLIISLSLIFSGLYSQKKLLDDPEMLAMIHEGIYSIYDGDFESSREMIELVNEEYSSHPVSSFLEAFYIYWKYFPLTLNDPESDVFGSHMVKCIEKAEKMLVKNENDLEGVFFDLFGRAFYIMYWSDNGKPGKVFPHLNILYKHTVKGFDLKEEFVEFYFTTGLYNYYIEAYPEKYPVYKPIAALFSGGDKGKGIKQLEYCAENAVFVNVEAKLFLCLIYLHYEKDLKKASEYAAELYREFPKNEYYTGKYLEILLYNDKYFFAPVLLKNLKENGSPFALMQYHLYNGMYLEKFKNDFESAKKEYAKALELSESFGEYSSYHNAIAWMGLSRYYSRKENEDESREYFRMASSATEHEHILNDQICK